MEIGAQFYTLRYYCKTLDGLSESLKKVADIGYKNVQISGVCAYEPAWLAEQLKANGLQCVITHYSNDKIIKEPQQTVKEHRVFGCRYIGIGCMPGGLEHPEDYDNFVSAFKPSAKKIHELGCLLMYHNHQFEFMKDSSGKLYIERILEDFSPEELGITMDTYWVQFGGGDPAWWLEHMSGRVPCIHLKDMACVEKNQRMAVIGEGNINFDAVFRSADKAGVKYMLVEQDDCYGEDPFECLKRSYKYLKAQGLA